MLQVVEARVSKLVLNPRNPRRLRPERKAQFLRTLATERELMEARPVIARRKDRVVIAGNQRVQLARELGWKTIPTVFVEVDEIRGRCGCSSTTAPSARTTRILRPNC